LERCYLIPEIPQSNQKQHVRLCQGNFAEPFAVTKGQRPEFSPGGSLKLGFIRPLA
jgi:hypothetical protein